MDAARTVKLKIMASANRPHDALKIAREGSADIGNDFFDSLLAMHPAHICLDVLIIPELCFHGTSLAFVS